MVGKLKLDNRPPIDVAVKMSKKENLDFEKVPSFFIKTTGEGIGIAG